MLVCLRGNVEILAVGAHARFRVNPPATFEYANGYFGDRLEFRAPLSRPLVKQQKPNVLA